MNPEGIDSDRVCRRVYVAATRLSELGDDLLNAGYDDVAERLYVLAEDVREVIADIHRSRRSSDD